MNQSESILANRELGQLGVTIGTSLALEGAIGIHPERPTNKPEIKKYSKLFINVRTLFRNIFHCLTAEQQDQVLVKDLVATLSSEINIIEGAMRDAVGDNLRIVFYDNRLSKLNQWFPHASIKRPTTPKQRIYAGLLEQTIAELPQYLDEIDFRYFDGIINDDGQPTLLLSHSVIDLLSAKRFQRLDLLESHTGKIKQKNQWGSKLGIKDPTMPFNTFTLQVFGDNNVYISPLSIKYRRAVMDVAKSDRWSPITTLEKIRVGLITIKDEMIRRTLLDVYESKSF